MYHLSLEPLLKHRKHIEEEQQKELAASKRLLLAEKEKLWNLETTRTRCLRELQERQVKGIRAVDISLYSDFIGQVSIQIKEQQKTLLRLEKNHGKKRNKLIEAMKKRKTVDQLKQNRLKTYKRELQRKEQIWMDEIAINGFQSPESSAK